MHTVERRPGRATPENNTFDLVSISRALAGVTIGMVHTVERAVTGPDRVRTAERNAWAAICADRERAMRRAEIRRAVAALAAGRNRAENRNRAEKQSGSR